MPGHPVPRQERAVLRLPVASVPLPWLRLGAQAVMWFSHGRLAGLFCREYRLEMGVNTTGYN